jgi:hypothetical protein
MQTTTTSYYQKKVKVSSPMETSFPVGAGAGGFGSFPFPFPAWIHPLQRL